MEIEYFQMPYTTVIPIRFRINIKIILKITLVCVTQIIINR